MSKCYDRTVTIKLSAELDAKVACFAKKLKKSRSAIVRLALRKWLSEPDLPERPSAYQMAEKYCGVLEALPADLSSNSDHLEGYGHK